MADLRMDGVKVLLVEDDALIALDIEDTLVAAGATVIGPYATLAAARQAARGAAIDLAILDIDLHGEEVFPAAAVLRERGVPFLFYTGRPDREALTSTFQGVPVCRKPLDTRQLMAEAGKLITLAA
ncbi:response regulator [Pelagibacterium montanilacus]|uniref:response regulator n=1 Tax=Pelagibacterium montanilacus TaxID=2185280 RepID=UPI000F8DA080|nr:response regulator [Pelagibacterium montanilacus]